MRTKLLYAVAAFSFTITFYAQEVPVLEKDLPAEARTFLKDHFKSGFHHAIKEVANRKVTYDVVLNDNTEIEFTEAGRWKDVDGKCKAIPYTFLQPQILDYVKQTYPGQPITGIELEDSEYEVTLGNGMDLKFNARGVFVKVD
ncbi:PepSY-like domain-containing protein [Flavobacterium sp. MFBS3-15]|uniref:PepSY-like domain-containing protein n=1 Tax=Flavobacterium sp. MFBS3-15 TaxID=2989816 RepID=UPI002235C749|nr:PepSY-like domain-containing protein [Flavobacterium sp. MFBS3-15]MCW4467503.1 PepSY-like domain-containing protein [Flavobacterium sp. MFBS3-15]